MRVTITKLGDGYYSMTVTGNRGPALGSRRGPGHGAVLPHDVAHLLAEMELGLQGGVFGRVARARSTWFPLLDGDEERRHRRQMKRWRPSPQDRADMAESERMAGIGTALLERRLGTTDELPDWFGRHPVPMIDDAAVQRVVDRFAAFAARWQRLASGESIEVDWALAPHP